MHRTSANISFIILISTLLASCGLQSSSISSTPTSDLVGTIVAGTMDAFLLATPVPSDTPAPSLTPTITPTPTMPVPIPPGWGVYWNQIYGFAFSHPNLYNCHLTFGYPESDEELVASFHRKDTCLRITDTVQDGVNVEVKLNSEGLSIREVADKYENSLKQANSATGPNVTISEALIHPAGQEGILVIWENNYKGATAFIPFPNSQRIFIFRVYAEEKSDFIEIARKILDTLRFVNQSPELATMATQTAEFFLPPTETSRVEYTDINELLTQAPFRPWLPTYVPEGFSLSKSWVAGYNDGSQQVGLAYSVPGESVDNPLKQLIIVITKTSQEISLDWLFHQPDMVPDTGPSSVLIIPIHQQDAYFWTNFPPRGFTDVLDWREAGINFHVSLFSDWTVLEEGTVYQPSDIISQVANSMAPH
jgi:hypothetical protein